MEQYRNIAKGQHAFPIISCMDMQKEAKLSALYMKFSMYSAKRMLSTIVVIDQSESMAF